MSGIQPSGPDHRPALRALDRPALTYGRLRDLVESTRAKLSRAGTEADSVLAMALPSSPAFAGLFLAISETSAAAPLNPGLTQPEFELLLGDLRASALVTEAGFCPQAVAAARSTGIPIVWASSSAQPDASAGDFRVVFEQAGIRPASRPLPAGTALLLHTSGTTGRPKLVPLTRDSLARSARNIAATLRLGPDDCSLTIMPLFHVHGLVAGLLAPLLSGGSAFCALRFDALRFFSLLKSSQATWYTAVPTMHQAILARAGRHRREAGLLRFARSCSAPLPGRVAHQLEELLEAPVIGAYGMTEAAHQISSNPLPPELRKDGTVGCGTGVEIAILDQRGHPHSQRTEGEVAIRGACVMSGYLDNPQANSLAFSEGWFRTGDLGRLDPDGYLTLTGRLKEIINCGGEKICPQEIDQVLMGHPEIEQALTFPLPHDKLGETVAAAVVLKDGASLQVPEIRDFAAQFLAGFKVPSRILLVSELPKGPTGKLQRNHAASTLGLA